MNEKVESSTCLWRMVFSTMASCVISMCGGMTYGVSAVMLPQLRQDKDFNYDGSQDSWIASIANFSMIFGGVFSGSILDRYGRKLSLILIGIPFIAGWTCIAFARSTVLIIIGRFITGISSGAHLPVALVYIGEITAPKYRTIALSFPLAMLHVGVLFTHLCGGYLSWRLNAIVCIFPPVISSIGFLYLKESPLWLISKGKTEEGVNSFRWFRGTDEVAEEELKAVLQRPVDDKKNTFIGVLNVICTLSFIKPLMIAMLLVANIQCSGIAVFYYYAQDIFEGTLSGQVDPFTMMIATDCIRGSITILVCLFAKILPKKITLIVVSLGIAVFLYMLVAYLLLLKNNHIWVPTTCLILYIGLSGPLTPIAMSFVPEVMPNSTRGLGSGMASSFLFILQFILVKVTPDVLMYYGTSTFYAFFATGSLVSGLLLIYLLPETGGKTLQSIEDSFNKNNKSDQTAL